jgi:hypothetical protein
MAAGEDESDDEVVGDGVHAGAVARRGTVPSAGGVSSLSSWAVGGVDAGSDCRNGNTCSSNTTCREVYTRRDSRSKQRYPLWSLG